MTHTLIKARKFNGSAKAVCAQVRNCLRAGRKVFAVANHSGCRMIFPIIQIGYYAPLDCLRVGPSSSPGDNHLAGPEDVFLDLSPPVCQPHICRACRRRFVACSGLSGYCLRCRGWRDVRTGERLTNADRKSELERWRVLAHESLPRQSKVSAGWPDISGVLPPAGRAFFIECKSARGRLRPGQQALLEKLAAAGALVIVARSLDEVIAAIAAAPQLSLTFPDA